MAGDARDSATASALATSPVRRRPPFFCQIEAVETAIWLPKSRRIWSGKRLLDNLKAVTPTRTLKSNGSR